MHVARKTRRPSRATLVSLAALLLVALAAAALVLAAAARGASPAAAETSSGEAPDCAPGVDFLGFSDALNKRTFEGTSVGGLSALAYDPRRGTYYSLVDNGPEADSPARLYELRLPLEKERLKTPSILDVVTNLRGAVGQPFTASNFDGEGVALVGIDDFFASSETEPSIRRFDLDGRLIRRLAVPQKFLVAPAGQATRNQTFESLSLSPNGRSLFTAVEGPLAPDGRTADGGNRIRVLRYGDPGPGGFEPEEELFYLTEPGQGVVEIVALGERELLVLERGFVPGQGNTVRVFKVSLKGAEDVSDEPSLAAPGLEPVEKELLLDLASCPSSGATTPGTQANPLLDNFEALTLGPRLPGDRRSLVLVSDDNFSAGQVTRVVALGVENKRLR